MSVGAAVSYGRILIEPQLMRTELERTMNEKSVTVFAKF